MTEQGDRERKAPRRRPQEPLTWGRFRWQHWMSDAAIRQLTDEQRGRFMDVRALAYSIRPAGVMTEEQVRTWARYSPREWETAKKTFALPFAVTRSGLWKLNDVIEDSEWAWNQHKAKVAAGNAAAAKRRAANELPSSGGAAAGAADGAAAPPAAGAAAPHTRQNTTENQRKHPSRKDSGRPQAGSGGAEAGAAAPTKLAELLPAALAAVRRPDGAEGAA